MKRLLMLLGLLAPGLVPAAEPATAPGLNIIGSQEAPTVLNVVPWKEREVRLDPRDPTSRLLDRVLEPLDPDVLRREMEYHQALTQQPETHHATSGSQAAETAH